MPTLVVGIYCTKTTSPIVNSSWVGGPSASCPNLRERPARHSVHTAGVCPHQRQDRFCSRTCTVASLKALMSRRLTANLLEMLSRKRTVATRPLRCVAVMREWIRITAPGNNVTEVGHCRVGMIFRFSRFQCIVEPCAAGSGMLRAAHQA